VSSRKYFKWPSEGLTCKNMITFYRVKTPKKVLVLDAKEVITYLHKVRPYFHYLPSNICPNKNCRRNPLDFISRKYGGDTLLFTHKATDPTAFFIANYPIVVLCAYHPTDH
jgi:hypothetical protein